MTGLPKSIIKKYGVTKKAWSVYRGSKSTMAKRGRKVKRAHRAIKIRSAVHRVKTHRYYHKAKNPLTKMFQAVRKYALLGGVAVANVDTIRDFAANPNMAINRVVGTVTTIASNPVGTLTKIFNAESNLGFVAGTALKLAAKFIPNIGGKYVSYGKQMANIAGDVTLGVAIGRSIKGVIY